MVYDRKKPFGTEQARPADRKVTLRDEKRADGSHLSLWSYLDAEGRLHIDGQDLGPVTKSISPDGEYEYFKTVAKEDIPRLVKVLGGKPGDDILDLLAKNWTGEKSYLLENTLRESQIRVAFSSYC